ncbi:MAG: hypothetical protein HY823_11480 [Acidobacteria bacterium]|nr:hypothetical protein [Acidobacteriota bacterium]
MKVRHSLVATAAALASTLPALGADFNVGTDTRFSISGFMAIGLKQASVQSVSSARANGVGPNSELRLDDNTSRIFFSGSTKIAEGWNAVFQIGSRFLADVRPGDSGVGTVPVANISGWADDDTWAGIAGPYGRLIFGKNSFWWPDTIGLPHISPALDGPGENYRVWDVQGLSTFTFLNQAMVINKAGVIGSAYTLGITRSRNVLRYDSPNINKSGVDFAIAHTKNAVGAEQLFPGSATQPAGYARDYNAGGTTWARVRYNGNGLSLILSMLDQKLQGGTYTSTAFNGPLDTTGLRFGASYKFGMGFKVGFVYDQTTIANGVAPLNAGVTSWGQSVGDAKRTVMMVPVSYAMGDHMFHFTWAKAGNVSDASDTGANQLCLAWDYALNKKTFIGIQYTTLKNDKNAHYNPFLLGTSFGASASNPAGATQAANINGEGFNQIQLGLHFWF